MLSRLLPVSWQCHTVVSDRTVSHLSPHSGILVLVLSRMLPVNWQCHTVVSDHTVFKKKSITTYRNNSVDVVTSVTCQLAMSHRCI